MCDSSVPQTRIADSHPGAYPHGAMGDHERNRDETGGSEKSSETTVSADAAQPPKKVKGSTKGKKRGKPSIAPLPPPRDTGSEARIRKIIGGAAAAALAGIALVGTGPSILGMALLTAGVVGLIAGIHSFGRLGPDPNAET